MNNLLIKIKLIYLQFLLITIGFIVLYSSIIYLVVYRFQLFAPNEELINFWLPIGLPVIPAFIWIRPRIKLLILKDKRGNLPFLYFFAAVIAMAIPTIIAQQYLLTAAGKLTIVKNVDEIDKSQPTKYYEIKNHLIDKEHVTVHRRAEVSGRNNEYLTFHIYLACPILPRSAQMGHNAADSIQAAITPTNPVAWLGTEYTRGMSNHSSDAEKESVFKQFGIDTYNQFKTQNLDHFVYLDYIGNNDRRKGYRLAIQSQGIYANTDPIIFEAKDEPFDQRNGDSFAWIFGAFGIGAAIYLIMVLIPKLNKREGDKLSQYSTVLQWQRFKSGVSKIRWTKDSPVSFIIIGLNILVFLVMVCAGLGFISFDGSDLYTWGANYRPAVMEGQWWRLLTNIFLHGGLMHMLFNMYGLLFVSIFLEPILGKTRYLISYFICGLAASIASIWWHPHTLSVGASGAIFGLYGVLTALLTTKKADASSQKALLLNNGVFIVINLLIGLTGGIDNAAHIGGLLSGFVMGYIMYFYIDTPKRKYTRKKKLITPESESEGQVVT